MQVAERPVRSTLRSIRGGLLTLYTFGLRRERIPGGLSRGVWASIIWVGIGNFTIVRVLFMLSLERHLDPA